MEDKTIDVVNLAKAPEEKPMGKGTLVLIAIALILVIVGSFFFMRQEHLTNCTDWIEKGSNSSLSGSEWKYAGQSKYLGWHLVSMEGYDNKKIARCKA